jgi:hypothetical protein
MKTLQRMQRDKEARTIESEAERSQLHAALQVRYSGARAMCPTGAGSTHVVSGCGAPDSGHCGDGR